MKEKLSNLSDEKILFELSELFKVFGDSSRIKILCLLLNGEKNVSELTESLSITQSAISQQLRVLKLNGLVKYRREGKSLYYSLEDEHVQSILEIGIEHLMEK